MTVRHDVENLICRVGQVAWKRTATEVITSTG